MKLPVYRPTAPIPSKAGPTETYLKDDKELDDYLTRNGAEGATLHLSNGTSLAGNDLVSLVESKGGEGMIAVLGVGVLDHKLHRTMRYRWRDGATGFDHAKDVLHMLHSG